MYCKYDKTGIDKILICDQGIFQALVSIAHIDKIKSSKHAQKVMDVIKNFEIKFINCEVDPQLSEERLKFRKNGGSRFDKMNEEERTANLLKQQDNFKILRNCLKETVNPDKIIKIDTRNETISNAQLIFDEIVKK